MIKHTAFGMKIGGLLAANGGGQFGKDMLQQTAIAQQHQSARGMRRPE